MEIHEIQGKKMTTYVPYIRTIEGTIERNNLVSLRWRATLGSCWHEETLIGWPESKVFWEHEEGYSVCLAPLKS